MKIEVTLSPKEVEEAIAHWLLNKRGLYGTEKFTFNMVKDFSVNSTLEDKYKLLDVTIVIADYGDGSSVAKQMKKATSEAMTVDEKKKLGLDLS